MNDDLSLTIDSKSKFMETSKLQSTINGAMHADSNKKPIIYGKDWLNSIPSEIIHSLPQNDNI